MEERDSPRFVTQRHLEVDRPAPDDNPAREPPAPIPPTVPGPPAPLVPSGPSNGGLLERQRRWFRERARFESRRPEDDGSK